MFFRYCIKPYRTVNSCTGIPAAVWLVVVDHIYTNYIFLTKLYMLCCIYIKTKVTIGMICHFFIINIYACFTVNAFKFQDYFFFFCFFRKYKSFLIGIILRLIPSGIYSACTCLASLIQLHGIVGKCNRKSIFFFPCFIAYPILVK